ncbi:ABC transporter ATP-binding protein [bacterium]|nr:ABC transporter ATP-binding protein [Rubripirellula sp.]MDB4331598.1 ABC transporter ATP-binding protein [bacterium]MDB4338728.1 ABC transporter ATP-binding protein [Rubripirellula sp.]
MIELQNLTIRAGLFVLEGIDLQVETGCYAALMGKTGRGKTTILEAIGGLRRVESGHILIHKTDVTDWSPADREVGYVPQDLALFPTFSVKQHLEFALRLRHWSHERIESRSCELASQLGITHLLDRGIEGLSGGESQRVALGRALSFNPSVLLLDEPLSALDSATRNEMQVLLKAVTQETGVTTLHITHNQDEADALADCSFELQDGQVLQC